MNTEDPNPKDKSIEKREQRRNNQNNKARNIFFS